MRTFNNRQMSAAFKKLGFRKSEMQLTRMGISYEHPKSLALFTFAKADNGGVFCTAPREDKLWSFPLGISQDKFDQFLDAGVVFPWDDGDDLGELGPREALLCVARAFAKTLKDREDTQ